MVKKRKNQNSKTPNTKIDILSNSLLPARHDGEKPDLPFNVKEEPEDPDLADILSLVEAAKHNTITPEDAESSSHSNVSTATEPMETYEGTIHDSVTDDFVEYQMVPSSFEQFQVKEEPMVAGNQESTLGEFMPNNHPENCPKNDVFTPLINSEVLKESVENNQTYQGITHQEMTNNVTFKTEAIENEDIAKSQNYTHEKSTTKRKSDMYHFGDKLEVIRKRMKKEPGEDGQNLYVPVNENRMPEVDHENLNAEVEEIDNDIAVLPILKTQKKIDVITISDDEDDLNSTSENEPVIYSPKKTAKKIYFSMDILKYFNVVSQLDRHDCQTALDYLSKYKAKHILQKIFPHVKKEKSKSKIEKSDILFRRITTERNSDTQRLTSSPNVNPYFTNVVPVQHATATEIVTFPVQYAAASQNVNFSSQTTLVSQHVNLSAQSTAVPEHANFTIPVISPSTTIYPNLPVPDSSNFGLNVSQNPQVAAPPNMMDVQELQNIIEKVKILHSGLKLKDRCDLTILNPHQNLPLQDPCQNSPVLDPHQNTPLQDQDQNPPVHDPRLRKKTLLGNDNNIQLINTSFIPSMSVSLPNQEYQSFPGPNSSYPTRVAVSSSKQMNPDPLIAAKKVTFPNRKGKKNLLLYNNVGKEDVTQHFDTLILQWNPSWMEIQKSTGIWPPISNSYPSVVYSYRNEMDYYNTYVPLHLLHVWYSIYQCWEKETFTVINRCKVQSVQKLDNGIKISCSVELEDTQVWPKRDDIIWCKHNGEMAFLRVEVVQMKPARSLGISKLKMTLKSLHVFNLKLEDEISFYILWNMCTAYLQADSLNSLDSSMKELILKPEFHESYIGVVELNGNNHIKQQRDSVFDILKLDSIHVIVIQTYQCNYNSVLMLTHLSFNISCNAAKYGLIPKNDPKQQVKVLIIIKNDELIYKLFKSLSQYNPVLAVRTKQIGLPSDLIKHTLDHLDGRGNLSDILKNHHIFITTFSAFGNAEKTHLSKLKNLICIIDDAHLCTEVETALPLTLRIKKLLLIGLKCQTLNLPEVLKNQNYHISLFLRLLKAKRQL